MNYNRMTIIIVCLTAAINATTVVVRAMTRAPKVEVVKKPEKVHYGDALKKAIQENGQQVIISNPSDAVEWCKSWPKLGEVERIEVLASMIGGMIENESGGDSASFMRECNKSRNVYGSQGKFRAGFGYCMKGNPKIDDGFIISRGLLQMSLESSQSYGCKEIQKSEDLHDPTKNLNCGLKIFNRLVTKDNQFSGKNKGASRYWAVMRQSNKAFESIKSKVQKNKLCNK